MCIYACMWVYMCANICRCVCLIAIENYVYDTLAEARRTKGVRGPGRHRCDFVTYTRFPKRLPMREVMMGAREWKVKGGV